VGRVLVLRALGLGDLLCAVPALRGLRAAFGGDEITLAVPAALAALARLTGAVDRVLDAAPLGRLPAEARGADVAVNLHGSGPQSHRVLLAAAPGRLIAFAHRDVAETSGAPAWRDEEHEVARWCRMLGEHGIPADPDDLDLPTPSRRAPPAARGATLIHPGAADPARRWPPARWAQLARAEVAAGRRVLLTGGSGEIALARAVAARAGLAPEAVVAGGTDLLDLAALVAAAGRVLCGDTGIAHLATALGTPSLVLFGPTPPDRWGPPAGRPWHRVLWAGREGDPHADRPDPGLLAITVEEALEALAALPARASLAPAPEPAGRA
jgi:ADP-heptose:LPS heptosyltransferase